MIKNVAVHLFKQVLTMCIVYMCANCKYSIRRVHDMQKYILLIITR